MLVELPFGFEIQVPVAFEAKLTRFETEPVSRRQLANVAVDAPGIRDVLQRKVVMESHLVDVVGDAGDHRERLELRTEAELLTALRVIKRLLPKSITGREQALPPAVPDREREHSVQNSWGTRSRIPRTHAR